MKKEVQTKIEESLRASNDKSNRQIARDLLTECDYTLNTLASYVAKVRNSISSDRDTTTPIEETPLESKNEKEIWLIHENKIGEYEGKSLMNVEIYNSNIISDDKPGFTNYDSFLDVVTSRLPNLKSEGKLIINLAPNSFDLNSVNSYTLVGSIVGIHTRAGRLKVKLHGGEQFRQIAEKIGAEFILTDK